MDCLDPPMFHIPIDNWYCQECDAASSDESSEDESVDEEADLAEVNDLQEEIQNELGELPSTRLRARAQQPQIVRTLQSERIRNAILARRTQRVINLPSTSASTSLPSTSRVTATRQTKRKSPKKRKKRRTARSQVVEYGIKNGVKFPIKVKKRAVRKTKRKKKRKVRKARRSTKATTFKESASSFKTANSNVYDLQRGRQLAGLTNFNIFQPTNQLDYVPDDDEDIINENIIEASGDDVLTQGIINYINPHRRQAIIKKRVIDNFVTTSSTCDLIDSILNEKHFFLNPKSTALDDNKKVKKAADGNSTGKSNETKIDKERQTNVPSGDQQVISGESSTQQPNLPNRNEDENEEQSATTSNNPTTTCDKKSPPKKKKLSFDMFEEESQPSLHGGCPNFSIYDSVSDDPVPLTSEDVSLLEEVSENFDLVQMSDEGEHQINADDIEPAVIIKSQPASPDLDNDQISQERSYTPPLVVVPQDVDAKEDKKSKKSKDKDRRSRRQEMERYNVREKVREKTPLRSKDQFGRNRTRSRSRSRGGGKKRNRSRSKSHERKQRNRSVTRKRDSSGEDRNRKLKPKRKKSNTRSPSPRFNYGRREEKGEPSRRKRRERSPSEKPKKKKRHSKEKTTKEVYSSGQNILVSVNFSNQDEKRSTKSMSRDNNEPIVDITAKKKINVSSKPVAIIDLARSPFKELTPDYKKDVIELSDSEGEKHFHLLKSPDSTKLYDPFDILNSPPNQNVSSSVQQNVKQTIKLVEYRDTSKANVQLPVIQKHLNNEENLVSSSSSVNAFEKNFPARPNKVEALQHEVIQTLNMDMSIESPYSPGNDDTYQESSSPFFKTKSSANEKPTNILDELFGTSSPPAKLKSSSNKRKALN